jgi:ribose 1,5-bisphosphate isomerase
MADDASRIVDDVRATAAQIAEMETRGAVAIATAAADALATQAAESDAESPAAFRDELAAAAQELYDTRPTAVSLANALRYVLRDLDDESVDALERTVLERAAAFREEVEAAQSRLGEIGANRLQDGDTVMTHCHSTDALACIEAAVEDGKSISAIVKETRPRKQGHITARELREMGVPVTLIVDGAARRHLPEVDHVIVGADSIAADGSVINKIGTSGLAVLAREQGAQIMVAAATIKLHPDTLTGTTVEIEQRDETEVLPPDERAVIDERSDERGATEDAAPPIEVDNPAFDVTPPRYVDAIVTERGQFPPESIVSLMRELFGESVERPWDAPSEIVSGRK